MNNVFHTEREELFLPFADEIDAFYRAKFRYKSRCVHPRFPTVNIRRAAVYLYLRFNSSEIGPGNAVVIAAIEFREQRRGHGSQLLAKLVEMADRYGITSVGVEQTSSKPCIQNFVRKFGFKNHINDRNWIVPLDTLKEHLAQVAWQHR